MSNVFHQTKAKHNPGAQRPQAAAAPTPPAVPEEEPVPPAVLSFADEQLADEQLDEDADARATLPRGDARE